MAADTQQLIIQLKARGVKLTKGQLKQLDGQVKASKRSMVGMGVAVAGATIALVAMTKAISSFIRVGKEFEQSMANLKSISGASRNEMLKLSDTARKLGASTKFTASQVGGLQTEFAKLGFTVKEIQNATGATLALAAAVGADLSVAAAVAGQTVRAFQMDVKDTTVVTDVMAKSFASSALDMSKFTDSMSYVAPVAKMAGFGIQGTTAMIGTLANAGIHGSMAGTSLRRIFLELSNESSKLAKRLGGPIDSVEELIPALEKLNKEGVSTAEMKDLVGLRAVSAFNILLQGTDTIEELTEKLNDAGGAAQVMADIQLDTLEGKMTILNSAWEGMGIAIMDNFLPGMKDATDAMTSFIQSITGMIEIPMAEKMVTARFEAIGLMKAMTNLNTPLKLQEKFASQLAIKFPDISKAYKTAQKEGKSLKDVITGISSDLMNQIILSRKSEEIADTAGLQADAWQKVEDATLSYNESMAKVEQQIYGNIDASRTEAQIRKEMRKIIEDGSKTVTGSAGMEMTIYSKQAQSLVKLSGEVSRGSVEVRNQTKEYELQGEAVEKLQVKLQKLKDEMINVFIKPKDPGKDDGKDGKDGDKDKELTDMDILELARDDYRTATLEAEATLAATRKEQREQEALDAIFALEAAGEIETATYAQIDALNEYLGAGESFKTAMDEIFGVDYEGPARLISPEEYSAMLQEYNDIERGWAELGQVDYIAREDEKIKLLTAYLEEQVRLNLMAEDDKNKQIEKMTAISEKNKKDLAFATFSASIQMMSQNLNAAADAGIVSQKVAKAASVVATVVKTYESAQSAYNSAANIPYVGFIMAPLAAAAAIAAGMASLQQIKGTPEEKPPASNLEKYISSGKAAAKAQLGGPIGGLPHSAGGTMIEAEKGEFVIRKQAVDALGIDFLDELNDVDVGGSSFGEIVDDVGFDEFRHGGRVKRGGRGRGRSRRRGRRAGTGTGRTQASRRYRRSRGYQEGGEIVDLGIDIPEAIEETPPLNITFTGNVLSRDFVEGEVVEILQDYTRRGGEL